MFEEADATVDGGGGSHAGYLAERAQKKSIKKNTTRIRTLKAARVRLKSNAVQLRHTEYKIRRREFIQVPLDGPSILG